MSGFEIAGIALGVFPIAVKGLQHFVEGAQTMKRWWRYKIKLQGYAGTMESHRVYYLDTLEELLNGIVRSDEIEELIAQPGGDAWRQPQYEKQLKERLGRSYEAYLRTLKTMTKNLEVICEKLGIDTSGKVLWDEYSVVEREMKRIKITLSNNLYKELIDEIDKANKDIRDITHQNILLEPIRKTRRSRRPIAELKLIRKHAASLHQVLIAGKAWRCSCKGYHMASLRLEPRPHTLEIAKASAPSQFRFRVLLSTSGDNDPTAKSHWQEIEVAPSFGNRVPDAIGVIAPISENKTRRVMFAPSPASIQTTLSPQETLTLSDCEMIADICNALCTSQDLKKAIGFLVDEEDKNHKHYVYRANTGIGSNPRSTSLGELLSNARQESIKVSLLRSDRLQIAVTLASSVLQLDGTSWLKSEWTSDDIYFHNKDGKVSSNYSHPYLPWKQCIANDSVICSFDPLNLGYQMVRSQVLLALGLTLVELCFGKTLAEMQKLEDIDVIGANTKIRTAHRLLNSVDTEMGISYGDVVRRCLFQPFDVRNMSIDNEELQQKVFDDIVTPLIEDLNNFTGKSRIT